MLATSATHKSLNMLGSFLIVRHFWNLFCHVFIYLNKILNKKCISH